MKRCMVCSNLFRKRDRILPNLFFRILLEISSRCYNIKRIEWTDHSCGESYLPRITYERILPFMATILCNSL
ncbi:hypothetical protein CW304_27890 [Bacillus sp. UFRGS-B20]|nr:hypothetical protein CW304_27890 [Bacillus sp. UFRGS-B20]